MTTNAIPYICLLILINVIAIVQIHIGFCIVAAIAPPIVFEGNSLT